MEKVNYFDFLPEEIIEKILVLCGNFSYFTGQVCQKWKEIVPPCSREIMFRGCFSDGHLDFLKKIYSEKNMKEILAGKNIDQAFTFRQFEVLEWVHSKGYKWERKHYHKAVEVGYLKFLIREEKSKFFSSKESIARYAVKGGYLEVIQWLREETFDSCIQVAEYAAYFGQIKILEWITNKIGLSGFLWKEAVQGGQFEVLEWLKERECPRIKLKLNPDLPVKDFEVVKWLLNEGHEIKSLIKSLSMAGQLELLKWVVSKGYPFDSKVCFHSALRCEKIEVMKWVRKVSYLWQDGDFEQLVEYADFETLIWAIEDGCSWSEERLQLLVKKRKFGNFDLLRRFAEWKSLTFISESESEDDSDYFYSTDDYINEILREQEEEFGGSRILD